MNTLHMIGNTHFDPAWLWTWDEAMASIRATFISALERMNEDPDFRYSFSTPAVFEWIENTDPELFSQIQSRVKEGRWDVGAEAWWLQPDCNLPRGESLIRQGLYGQLYLMEKFGAYGDSMFNIDSFGHSAMMPQLLSGCGIKNYVFTRPSDAHQPLPDELFEWVSPDGSRVLAYRAGGSDDGSYPQDVRKAMDARHDKLKTAGHDAMIVYGVSDHGGAPTKKAIADIRRAMDEMEDIEVLFSDVPWFFDAQKYRQRGEFAGELQPKFYGPFSDHAEVKRNNRRAEYALDRAEKAGFLAHMLCGRKYSPETLRRSWKDTLFCQFHDILGGTCIPDVFVDARDQQGRAIHTANEETHFAIQTICRNIKTVGSNDDAVWNLIMFNLSGADYSGICEAEVQWAWEFPWYENGIELIDEAGNIIPAQVINEKSVIPGFRSRFAFRAEIPAMGWRTYAVRKTGKEVRRDVSPCDIVSPFEFRVYEDLGDVWCFNTSDGYGKELEKPVLVEEKTAERGDILTRVRRKWKFRDSILEEIITEYADKRCSDYSIRVNWNEKHAALKLVPKACGADIITAAIPAGCIERKADGREYPAGEWLKFGGMTLLMDGIFAYDTGNRVPRLTVLRSPVFGDLRTRDLNEALDYRYMGQGVHEARIRIVPEDMSPARAADMAEQWNSPPVIVCEANHAGKLPPAKGNFSCIGAHLDAVKPAEDGSGFVVRISERSGSDRACHMTISGAETDLTLKNYEIVTLKCKNDIFNRTDMLENVL